MGIKAMKICFNITFHLYESSTSIQRTRIKNDASRQNGSPLGCITGILSDYGLGRQYHLFAYNNTLFIIEVLLEFIAMTRHKQLSFIRGFRMLFQG